MSRDLTVYENSTMYSLPHERGAKDACWCTVVTSQNRLFITALFCRPEYRRQGYAKRLMVSVLDTLRKEKVYVTVDNFSGDGMSDGELKAWYYSLGFVDANKEFGAAAKNMIVLRYNPVLIGNNSGRRR